jgi:hypothetical protein
MLFSRIIFSRAESSVRLLCIILPEGLVLLRSLQALALQIVPRNFCLKPALHHLQLLLLVSQIAT